MEQTSQTSGRPSGETGNGGATKRIAEKAHEAVDRAAEIATETEQKVRTQATRAAEKLKATEETAVEAFDESMTAVSRYVQANPLASAGIAFAAGVLVSVLLRR